MESLLKNRMWLVNLKCRIIPFWENEMNENESTSLGKDRDGGTNYPERLISRQAERILDSLKCRVTEDLNDLVSCTAELNTARQENYRLQKEIQGLIEQIHNQAKVVRDLLGGNNYRNRRFAEIAVQLPVLPSWPATPEGGHYPTTNAVVAVERKHSSTLVTALSNIVNGPLNSREDVRQAALDALQRFSLSPDTPRALIGEDRIDNKPEIRIGEIDAETAKACGDLERSFNKLKEKFSGRYHF